MGTGELKPFNATEHIQAANMIRNHVSELEPICAAAQVSGLLTCPELGANAYRLEALLHEILQCATGEVSLTVDILHKLFALLKERGDSHMEDASEDVFVSLTWYAGHNYRIFEGLWEGGAFYLQRFLNIVDRMPDDVRFIRLKSQVLGLLTLSEAIAQRRSLPRYILGERYPQESIPVDIANSALKNSKAIQFTRQELDVLGVKVDDLLPFSLTIDQWRDSQADIEDIRTQAKPILINDNIHYVVYPSAVTSAIRLHIIDQLAEFGLLENLQHALVREYSSLFHDIPLLGAIHNAPISWKSEDGYHVGDCVAEYDAGRYLHFFFVVDGFAGHNTRGLCDMSPDYDRFKPIYTERMNKMSRDIAKRGNFREGLSLIIGCGWGRGILLDVPEGEFDNWRCECIGAGQLVTLSWSRDMKPLNLLRLNDHEQALSAAGVDLQNLSGLLNLYAWAVEHDYHLVPHHQIELDMISKEHPLFLMIDQSSLVNIRHQVLNDWDPHVAKMPDGDIVRVRRHNPHSYFEEDARQPIYDSVDDAVRGTLRTVYEGSGLTLWLSVSAIGDVDSDQVFTYWDAFSKWLPRICPAIESKFEDGVTANLLWHLEFPEYGRDQQTIVDADLSVDDIIDGITTCCDRNASRIQTVVPLSVMAAFQHPENHAERALLASLIRGIAELAGQALDAVGILENAVPDRNMREFHMYMARDYADYVLGSLPAKAIMPETFDDTLSRIGLAWRAYDKTVDNKIGGFNSEAQHRVRR
jgi:hypothetical protein